MDNDLRQENIALKLRIKTLESHILTLKQEIRSAQDNPYGHWSNYITFALYELIDSELSYADDETKEDLYVNLSTVDGVSDFLETAIEQHTSFEADVKCYGKNHIYCSEICEQIVKDYEEWKHTQKDDSDSE